MVNVAPTVDMNGAEPGIYGTIGVVKGGPPVLIGANATITDPDTSNFAGGQLIVFLNGARSGDETVILAGGGITVSGSIVSYNGVAIGTIRPPTLYNGIPDPNWKSQVSIDLNANAGISAVQALLQRIACSIATTSPGTEERFATVYLREADGTHTYSGTTVTVGVTNSAPVVTIPEGGFWFMEAPNDGVPQPVRIMPHVQVSDANNNTLASATIRISGGFVAGEDVLGFTGGASYGNITGSYDASTGLLTLTSIGATATLAQWRLALSDVTYVNVADDPSGTSRTFTIIANDGQANSAAATTTLGIINIEEPPVLDLNGTGPGREAMVFYTEQEAAITIAPDAVVTDPDNSVFSGGQLTVSRFGGGGAEHVLAVIHQGAGAGQIGVQGSTITYGGVAIGTFTGGGAQTLVVNFNSQSSAAAVQSLIRALSYSNSSDRPPASVLFDITLTDGRNGSSTARTTVSITAVDDPFTIDLNGAQPGTAGNATYVIGSSPTAVAAAALLTDDDSPNLAGSVLTLGLQGGRSGDVLSIVHQGDGPGQIGLHDNNVIAYEGMLIGHYYGGASIILDASFVPIQAVQALIRAVSFTNVTASPPTSDRIVTFQLRLQNGTTYSEAARVQIATPPSTLQGDAGDNQLTGTDGDDLFRLEHGGNDSASGGGGVDGFIFGGAFNALDSVDGGAGSDQIGLQGVYSGLTLGANSTVNVEMIVLLAGNDTRFMDLGGALTGYNITTVDANVATGQMLTIQANTLRAGENFTLNGAAETDGSFFTFGGEGIENLTGGQQVDGFYFGTGRFGSADRIDGQGGSDQFGLQGNYSGLNALTLGADQLTSVEFIVLMSASDTRFGGGNIGQSFSYTLTMNDGNVAAGQQMIVQANTLRAGEVLTFDGSAETNGSFRLFAGAAADTIIGSQTGDELWGQGGADRIEGRGGADTLRGGLDNDVFAYRGVADSVTASRDKIMDFASGDLIDFAPLAQAVGWSSFQFIGTAAISRGGQLRVEQAGSQAMLEVHVDGDGVADLVIDVTVIDGHTLTAADFLGVSSPQNALAPFGPDHGMLLRPTIEPIAQLADFAF